MIFRCCLQWRTFQADRTVLFDKARSPQSHEPNLSVLLIPHVCFLHSGCIQQSLGQLLALIILYIRLGKPERLSTFSLWDK